MQKNKHLSALLAQRKVGYGLSRDFYVDEDIYHADLDVIFRRQWLFAAPLAAFKNSGDYITLQLANEPLVFIRDKAGDIRGFYNVCRHRGSKLLMAERGNIRGKITCPYHQWMYELDGALAYASHMNEQPAGTEYALQSVHVAVLGGGVHFCLDAQPPSLAAVKPAIDRYAAAYRPECMKIARQETHWVDANWKLLVENNRECGHCRGAHPELMSCVYDFGLGGDNRSNTEYEQGCAMLETECRRLGMPADSLNFPDDSFYRLARLPFRPGFVSETLRKNTLACEKPMGSATAATGQLRAVFLPNCWGHYLSDYHVVTRLLPHNPLQSRLDVYWMVHEDAVAGRDYQEDILTAVWQQTTVQDAELVVNNQKGILSNAYKPGPYSPVTEVMVEHFADWYVRRMRMALKS